jgi:hypothetical protein
MFSAAAKPNDISKTRIEARLGRQFWQPTTTAGFDAESFSVFDEPVKRWTNDEVYAWRAFKEMNLDPKGRISIPDVLEETVKSVDSNQSLALFFEKLKSGTVSSISAINRKTGQPKSREDRYFAESPRLFEGGYTGHHTDDGRFMLVRGYACDGYYRFVQDLLETHFGLKENTLVPRRVLDFGEPVPMCVRLIWPERGISFYVECERKVYDLEDPSQAVGGDRWFDICSRWLIRANSTRDFHWE